jgi:hypothetical protein
VTAQDGACTHAQPWVTMVMRDTNPERLITPLILQIGLEMMGFVLSPGRGVTAGAQAARPGLMPRVIQEPRKGETKSHDVGPGHQLMDKRIEH